MSSIDVWGVVDVPPAEAYRQGRAIESFPRFMTWLDRVERLGPSRVRLAGHVLGQRRTWEAHVDVQDTSRCIRWHSLEGPASSGRVSFEDAGRGRTRVRLELEFEPETLRERTGAALGLFDAQAKADLERFAAYLKETADHEADARGREQAPGTDDDRPLRG